MIALKYAKFAVHNCSSVIITDNETLQEIFDQVKNKPDQEKFFEDLSGKLLYVIDQCHNQIDKYKTKLKYPVPDKEPEKVKKIIFLGSRYLIINFIKELIRLRVIADIADEVLTTMFYCTAEIDNDKYILHPDTRFQILCEDNVFTFIIEELRALGCFIDTNYYKQFAQISLNSRQEQMIDLCHKKALSSSKYSKLSELIIVIKNFSKAYTVYMKS